MKFIPCKEPKIGSKQYYKDGTKLLKLHFSLLFSDEIPSPFDDGWRGFWCTLKTLIARQPLFYKVIWEEE